jgi:exopolysaccharide production protein ExoZ
LASAREIKAPGIKALGIKAPGIVKIGILNSIQGLRAVAALAVLACHQWSWELGQAGVDLFFVVSGFVITYSAERFYTRRSAWKEFIRHRIARVVPLYWLVTAAVLGHAVLTHPSLESAGFSAGQVAASFAFFPWPSPTGAMLPVVPLGWSLNFEMFFYALFACALMLPRAAAVAAVSGLILAGVALNATVGLPTRALAYAFQPIMLEFVFGMTIALFYRRGVQMPSWARAALALGGLCVLALAPPGLERTVVWGLPAAAIVAAAVLGPDIRRIPPLSLLGDASYSIYLCHVFIINAGRSFDMDASLLLVLTVVSCVGIHRLVEKPITAFLYARSAADRRRLFAGTGEGTFRPVPSEMPGMFSSLVGNPAGRKSAAGKPAVEKMTAEK